MGMDNNESLYRPTSQCCICGNQTAVIVNINLVKVPVCDPCCLTITKQTVRSLTLKSLQVANEE